MVSVKRGSPTLEASFDRGGPTPTLQVDDVTKGYGGIVALDHVDLDVDAGEIVGLLGPNGAGKTTLVSIVAGLCRPDSGAAFVCGVDVAGSVDRARAQIGLAPQELGVYPTLTVAENLQFFGRLNTVSRRTLERRISEVVPLLGLEGLMRRTVGTLSGGEQRRLHTACALLHRPALLLLDEPTAGADVATRDAILDLVRQLAADGASVIYTTHYLPEVEALDASVAVLDRGHLIARGDVQELAARCSLGAVELVFEGDAPQIELRLPVARQGSTLRITTDDPAQALASAIPALGPSATLLRRVEVLRPGLDGVYVALTGRPYVGDRTDGEYGDVQA